jgi:cytochrome b561
MVCAAGGRFACFAQDPPSALHPPFIQLTTAEWAHASMGLPGTFGFGVQRVKKLEQMRDPTSYPRAAALLHWFTAVLVLVLLTTGWYLGNLPRIGWQRVFFLNLHHTTGIWSAMFIVALIGRRLFAAPPSMSAAPSSPGRSARALLHGLLYVFLFLAALSGYLSSAFGIERVKVFGADLSPWGREDLMMWIGFAYVHRVVAVTLGVLIAIHFVDVLKSAVAEETCH